MDRSHENHLTVTECLLCAWPRHQVLAHLPSPQPCEARVSFPFYNEISAEKQLTCLGHGSRKSRTRSQR